MNILDTWNKLKINDIVYKNIDNLTAVYLKRCYKDCYIIEGVGCDIFNALINKVNYSDLICSLKKEYNVENVDIENDIAEFIEELINENILYINEKFTEEIKSASLVGNENITLVCDYYMKNKKPYKVFLETTYACNLNCDHCYLQGATNSDINCIEIDRIKEIINELSELGLVELVITGGEAGLYKHLVELIKYASSKNILVTLLSNGTIFDDNMIDKIIDAGIHDLRVSLYGFEDYHDKFVHRSGSFSNSVKTLSSFRKKAGIGSASCIITKENVDQLNDLKKYLMQMGIPISYSPLIIPTIYGDKSPTKLRLDYPALKNLIEEHNINIGGNKCTAGISRFRIMPNGNVNPCEMLRHITLGNIYESSFTEILNSREEQLWINTYSESESTKCKNCVYSKYCINCKGLSYLENGVLNSYTKFSCDIAEIQHNLYSPKKMEVISSND